MEGSKLENERHIKYWQRCLKTLLPTEYTSTDSSRMTLGFFILSALDILGAGADTFPEKERANIRKWVLHCQHPNGGFCGSPNHRYPDQYYADVGEGRQQMDPANLPATYFAILSLSFVGSLEDVNRDKCLSWLKGLQRPDGSFGEMITQEGVIEGGSDMRYCQIAAAIRWILRGKVSVAEGSKIDDINVENLVNHIRNGQTYDGGISESSQHEAHAGYTYCAIAALSFLDRLQESDLPGPKGLQPGLSNIPATIRWLVSRQVAYEEEKEETGFEHSYIQTPIKLQGVYEDNPVAPDTPSEENQFVGFNGRCNKRADTCYCFWVTASLDILGEEKVHLVNTQAIRRFLVDQTQHRIGGFGKCPGNPPDIYHSYLGLAALAVMKEPGLRPLDSALCISVNQKELIEKRRNASLVPTRTYWKNGFCYSVREDHPQFEEKMASSEEPPKFAAKGIEAVSKGVSEIKI